jgi:hypothetical protein
LKWNRVTLFFHRLGGRNMKLRVATSKHYILEPQRSHSMELY